jgi:hypothetical protein
MNSSRRAPHPAFGHPLPATRGEGLSGGVCVETLRPREAGEKVPKADEGEKQ